MKREDINAYIMLIKHGMFMEQLQTINKAFIKQIILKADGDNRDIDIILEHPEVMEIDDDLFYIKTSISKVK
ncbi:hypothetical protein ACPX19_12485 [Winogradskyella sp. HB-48]|uniref:hypothetical protein n=1 Tax=Winogradskyella sp. HB-48 TaxID=3416808 RepID=UPI003CF4E13F